jgi:hypothetical protein
MDSKKPKRPMGTTLLGYNMRCMFESAYLCACALYANTVKKIHDISKRGTDRMKPKRERANTKKSV